MMRLISSLFGVVWILIWVVIISAIIKSIKAQGQVKKVTKEVFRVADQAIRNTNVHTGDPHNAYTQPRRPEPQTADDFSDVGGKGKDSDTFDSDLNPKTTPQRVYRTKTTVNGKRVRSDRVYGVGSSERPSHGTLSKESRDDEKEWF